MEEGIKKQYHTELSSGVSGKKDTLSITKINITIITITKSISSISTILIITTLITIITITVITIITIITILLLQCYYYFTFVLYI